MDTTVEKEATLIVGLLAPGKESAVSVMQELGDVEGGRGEHTMPSDSNHRFRQCMHADQR